jgi:hypothetical protein
MPQHSLNSIRKTFDENLEPALLLFQMAARFASNEVVDAGSDPSVRPGQARRIAGLAFLLLVRAWEELVEGCLVRYTAGATAPSGVAPGLKADPAGNLRAAYTLVTKNGLGGHDDDQLRHLSVSSWDAVCKCSRKLFNDGGPFTKLSKEQRQALKDATTIRNRVAHASRKTITRFCEVARSGLSLGADQPLPRGYTVGHLLMAKRSGLSESHTEQSHFLYYHQKFLSMADVICPKQTSGR